MLASEELDCDDFWRRPTFEAEFRVRTLAVTHNPKAVHVDWMFEAYLVHLRCIRLQGVGEQEQVTHMCRTDDGSEARRNLNAQPQPFALGVLRRKRPFSQRLFTVEVPRGAPLENEKTPETFTSNERPPSTQLNSNASQTRPEASASCHLCSTRLVSRLLVHRWTRFEHKPGSQRSCEEPRPFYDAVTSHPASISGGHSLHARRRPLDQIAQCTAAQV